MKNNIKKLFLFALIPFYFTVKGQDENYNTIKSNDIKINNTYLLNTPKNKLSQLLVKADSIQQDTAQMTFYCDFYSIAYYKKSTLTICDSIGLVQFDMWDNTFKFSVKSKQIKIGDDEEILKQLFPKSYKIRDYMGDDIGTFQFMTCVRIYFNYGQYLLFMINKQGKIADINIWEDDS